MSVVFYPHNTMHMTLGTTEYATIAEAVYKYLDIWDSLAQKKLAMPAFDENLMDELREAERDICAIYDEMPRSFPCYAEESTVVTYEEVVHWLGITVSLFDSGNHEQFQSDLKTWQFLGDSPENPFDILNILLKEIEDLSGYTPMTVGSYDLLEDDELEELHSGDAIDAINVMPFREVSEDEEADELDEDMLTDVPQSDLIFD